MRQTTPIKSPLVKPKRNYLEEEYSESEGEDYEDMDYKEIELKEERSDSTPRVTMMITWIQNITQNKKIKRLQLK